MVYFCIMSTNLERPTGPHSEPLYPTLARKEILKADNARIERITDEMRRGFRLIEKYPKSVTFFGSARFQEGNKYYEIARSIAYKLSQKGYTIVTGGGPGIMGAANHGAHDAHGPSVGLNIKLPKEQHINPYTTDSAEFSYFFARKVALSFAAEAYIFFPGGFGTLDEFYEIATLVQTKRISPVPIICVCSEFWNKFDELHKTLLRDTLGSISPGDELVYTITDDEDEVVQRVLSEPVRNGIAYPHS